MADKLEKNSLSTMAVHVIVYFITCLVRLRALCRRYSVGGGALVNFGRRRCAAGPKISAAAARPVKFSNFAYLFKKFFSEELML